MKKIVSVLFAAVFMIALPFIFRPETKSGVWKEGDPVLTVVSPHNEAIRQEFADGFSAWHERKYGSPVRIDWRNIGGTTEIMRYLSSEYIGSMKGWWERSGGKWPAVAATCMLDLRFDFSSQAAQENNPEVLREIQAAFRTNDSPDVATSGIDLFFGGGVYDHGKAERQGLSVPPWSSPEAVPPGIFADAEGELIPVSVAGETWRGKSFFGTVLSTFGICWNPDRLADLGIAEAPSSWYDLAKPGYFGNVGITDPTKSGSVAKAFEMIVHQVCHDSAVAAGFTETQIDEYEALFAKAGLPPGEVPDGVPASYQAALEKGWENGMNLIRLIGANARYFTDSAGKVPIDVGMGATAAGICIDFFGRFQAEYTKTADGVARMKYATPRGGSCVSADPVSLLRGAPHRELAVRFIEFCLGEEGQKLWNGRVGTEGGPLKYALRRLPIRRDFYPSTNEVYNARAARHNENSSDDLSADDVNPFKLADSFVYRARWTGTHFGIQRDLVRALCLDSGDELRSAWKAIIENGGPERNPEAMAILLQLPEMEVGGKSVRVDWKSAVTVYSKVKRLEYMREWTSKLRANYRTAKAIAEGRVNVRIDKSPR